MRIPLSPHITHGSTVCTGSACSHMHLLHPLSFSQRSHCQRCNSPIMIRREKGDSLSLGIVCLLPLLLLPPQPAVAAHSPDATEASSHPAGLLPAPLSTHIWGGAPGSGGGGRCSVVLDAPDVERYGGDYIQVHMAANTTVADCAALCCVDVACAAFSFVTPCPWTKGTCVAGQGCCQLKAYANPPIKNTYGSIVRTGTVTRAAPGAWPVPFYPPSSFITSVQLVSGC